MAYSIMLWLVNPGSQAHEQEALSMLEKHRSLFPGARGGVNEPPAATRLVYGVYARHKDAKRALEKIAKHLEQHEPLQVGLENGTVFLIPTQRVHYAVLSKAERPKDKEA
jgi:hypothetical protein